MELVGFVDDSDDGLVLSDGHVGVGNAGFGDEEDDLCFFCCFDAAFDAHLLDGVGSVSDASCVDEAEGDVVQGDGVFDDVAGGALDVAHNGAVVAQEGVEQGALAYVWCSDDGDGYTILDGVAELEGVGEPADFLIDVFGQLDEFLAVGKFHVFFGEVKFQLEQGGHLEELVAQFVQFGAVSSLHLLHGNFVGGGVSGGDEVGYGFCLAEIHLAVEVCTLGVFAWLGHRAAMLEEEFYDALQDVSRTVT